MTGGSRPDWGGDDRWSHLVADSDEELHEFASRLGMRREWFQHKERRAPSSSHYDLPERSRQRGVGPGGGAGHLAPGGTDDAASPSHQSGSRDAGRHSEPVNG